MHVVLGNEATWKQSLSLLRWISRRTTSLIHNHWSLHHYSTPHLFQLWITMGGNLLSVTAASHPPAGSDPSLYLLLLRSFGRGSVPFLKVIKVISRLHASCPVSYHAVYPFLVKLVRCILIIDFSSALYICVMLSKQFRGQSRKTWTMRSFASDYAVRERGLTSTPLCTSVTIPIAPPTAPAWQRSTPSPLLFSPASLLARPTRLPSSEETTSSAQLWLRLSSTLPALQRERLQWHQASVLPAQHLERLFADCNCRR